jgi:hypothetical protein
MLKGAVIATAPSHWIDRIRSASGLLRGDAVASVRAALTAAEPKANLVQRP